MSDKHLKDRQHQRQKGSGTLVVTNKCVCQVLDLSTGGIAFGCTSERNFSEMWTADIVDESGVHVLDLPVKTVWAEKQELSSPIHSVKVV